LTFGIYPAARFFGIYPVYGDIFELSMLKIEFYDTEPDREAFPENALINKENSNVLIQKCSKSLNLFIN
jgi:hypothetical protein